MNKVEICGVNTSKLPVLTKKEKEELFIKIKEGDKAAREVFIHGNLRLVLSVIQRFTNRGEMVDDLFQVGCVGLIKAIDNFDITLNVRLSTYAVPMIAGEIRSQLRDQGTIKMSRSLKADILLVRRAENEFMKEYGVSPRMSQLAELTGMTMERLQEACQAEDVLRNMNELSETEAEREPALWEDGEERNVTRLDLAGALAGLEPRARKVIVLRYYRDYTQQQVADALGISQVQVCRIEKKTLKMMAEKVSG